MHATAEAERTRRRKARIQGLGVGVWGSYKVGVFIGTCSVTTAPISALRPCLWSLVFGEFLCGHAPHSLGVGVWGLVSV